MTEPKPHEPPEYGDPLTRPFWDAARRRELVVQRCEACGAHQLYPRPYCIACQSDAVAWVPASGRGFVYAVTTVRIPVQPTLEPPYAVALVELDEGPRLLGGVPARCAIGSRVRVAWREREDAPPLPEFLPDEQEH